MDYGDSVHEQILVCSAFSVLDISIDYQLRYISKDSQFCCRHSLSKISSGLTFKLLCFAFGAYSKILLPQLLLWTCFRTLYCRVAIMWRKIQQNRIPKSQLMRARKLPNSVLSMETHLKCTTVIK